MTVLASSGFEPTRGDFRPHASLVSPWIIGGSQRVNRNHQAKEARNELTIDDLCRRVIDEHAAQHCKPGTVVGYRYYAKAYIRSRIGHLRDSGQFAGQKQHGVTQLVIL